MKHYYTPFSALLLCAALVAFIVNGPLTQPRVIDKKMEPVAGEIPKAMHLTAQRAISKQEYHISPDRTTGKLQSPNRRQGLRAYYAPGLLTVQKRDVPLSGKPLFELRNKGIYADGRLIHQPDANAAMERDTNRVLIHHAGFDEEFINSEDGIRQNFIVNEAPDGTHKLTVRLAASGAEIADSGKNELKFKTSNGSLLIYRDLRCWDAAGRPLVASLSARQGMVTIDVDVAAAAFPVTIDPIVENGTPQNANALFEGQQDGAWLGYAVANAGHVNGDGYTDIVVGAPKYDDGQVDAGAVFIYYGSPDGVTVPQGFLHKLQTPAGGAGTAVACGGKYGSNGPTDIVVGIPNYSNGQTNEGAVLMYEGNTFGPDAQPRFIYESNQAGAQLGFSVAMAGDINWDRRSEILAGAPHYSNGEADEGALYVLNGLLQFQPQTVQIVEGNQAGALFGYSVAGASDVNADMFSDVVVGAPFYNDGNGAEGAAFVYHGGASGLVSNVSYKVPGNQPDSRFGHSVSTAGDVNGDGYADIVVGAYLHDNGEADEGAAFIYHGTAIGISTAVASHLEGNQANARFGWSVACAGDVNADGYADVLVGAPYFDKGETDEGVAMVFQGSRNGLSLTPASIIESNQADAWLGYSVSPAGDVNGDSFSDIVVGAYGYDNGEADEGIILVYHGAPNGIVEADRTVLTDYEGSNIGEVLSPAGDVNGDGYSDVVVGSPGVFGGGDGRVSIFYGSLNGIMPGDSVNLSRGNAQFNLYGVSVAGVGDVNGDGYEDVAVGSLAFENDMGVGPGQVLIYPGSASGISRTAAYELTGPRGFGWTVNGAGDINGDGYQDIVVFALYGSNDPIAPGKVFVYYGSSTGPLSDPLVLSGTEAAPFTGIMTGAADLNADRFDDLIIHSGVSGSTYTGAVYYGSEAGLGTTPQYSITGTATTAAGDVNRDGFNDIVATVPSATGYPWSGRVLYGSTSGISEVNGTLLKIPDSGTCCSPGVPNLLIDGAGDVNGDGYSDVIMGANRYVKEAFVSEGAFFVYHGSPTGASPVPTFAGYNEGDGDHVLGMGVAGAGDVNGDGYSDVMAGNSYRYVDGNLKQAMFVYYGNGRYNIRSNVRLYNEDLTTPYSQNYPNQSQTQNFGLGLFVKSFLGSSRVSMGWRLRDASSGWDDNFYHGGSQLDHYDLPGEGHEIRDYAKKLGPYTAVYAAAGTAPAVALTGQNLLVRRDFANDVNGSPTPALPLRLISFTAEAVENTTHLKWLTAEEENTGHFEVQRSADAKTWTALPELVPAGGEGSHQYNAIDSRPLSGTNYYRLKMIDLDQKFTYSRIVSVDFSKTGLKPVVLYPNPTAGKLLIRASNRTWKDVRLFSTSGVQVYASGKMTQSLDLSQFAAGAYLVVIYYTDGSQSTHEIMVTR
jgi:hypothetical protein